MHITKHIIFWLLNHFKCIRNTDGNITILCFTALREKMFIYICILINDFTQGSRRQGNCIRWQFHRSFCHVADGSNRPHPSLHPMNS